MVHVVTYDLKSPHDTGDDYDRVIRAVKSLGTTWCHLEKSVWLIVSDSGSAEIRDELKKYLYPADILFVAKLAGYWGSFNLGANRNQWLHNQTF